MSELHFVTDFHSTAGKSWTTYTVCPRYNTVCGVHDMWPRYKRSALYSICCSNRDGRGAVARSRMRLDDTGCSNLQTWGAMSRWMCGVTKIDGIRNERSSGMTKVEKWRRVVRMDEKERQTETRVDGQCECGLEWEGIVSRGVAKLGWAEATCQINTDPT